MLIEQRERCRALHIAAYFAAVACVLSQCSPGGNNGPAEMSVRDSAGVAIVQLPDLKHADTLAWLVDSNPFLRIGGATGTGKTQFGNIVGATRLSDGRIVVLDAMSSELRFFAADGRYLSSAGGAGGGPGELEGPLKLFRAEHDSLIVVDQHGVRFHVFTHDGRYTRSFNARPPRLPNTRPGPFPVPSARLADGSFVFQREEWYCMGIKALPGGVISIPESPPGGFCEDSSTFLRVRPDSVVLATYGTFVSSRKATVTLRDGTQASIDGMLHRTFFSVVGTRFLFADARDSELLLYDGERLLTRIVRIPQIRLPLSRGLLAGAKPHDSASAEEKRMYEMMMDVLGSANLPKHADAFLAVNPDFAGNIWVRLGVPSDTALAAESLRHWVVLDSAGLLRGIVRTSIALLLPQLFDMKKVEIGDDYILAVKRDSLDVQEVVLHRVLKRAG